MKRMRKSALSLVLFGLLGLLFFYATDPGIGPVAPRGNIVDAVNQSAPATYVGLAGSAGLLGLGLFLCTRRMA